MTTQRHIIPTPGPSLTPDRDQSWRDQAACIGEDPEVFFAAPSESSDRALALAVCDGCRVWEACLKDALATETTGSVHGIRGGTTPERRQLMLAKRHGYDRRRKS